MSAYYNEIDPYAAAWLRNLVQRDDGNSRGVQGLEVAASDRTLSMLMRAGKNRASNVDSTRACVAMHPLRQGGGSEARWSESRLAISGARLAGSLVHLQGECSREGSAGAALVLRSGAAATGAVRVLRQCWRRDRSHRLCARVCAGQRIAVLRNVQLRQARDVSRRVPGVGGARS